MAGFKEYLTVEGERMLAKMVAGTKISFTKVLCGDGVMGASQSERNMSELIHEVMQLDIASVAISGSNVVITSNMDNNKIPTDFYFREKAIYMSDGNREVLGVYANKRNDAEYVEAETGQFVEKKLKTIITLSTDAVINIEIKENTYASAPVISNAETIDDFVKSETASTLHQGETVIIKGVVYTLTGTDSTDINSYTCGEKIEWVKSIESLETVTEEGKAVDALVVKEMYSNIKSIQEDSSFHKSVTTIVDENTIKTEYADGSSVVTTFDDTQNIILETYYDKDKNIINKIQTTVTENTIEEKEIEIDE